MAFSSVDFLFLFLPAFLLAQSCIPAKNIVYVAFSLVFYFVGEGWYIFVIIISALTNFACGLWIDRQTAPDKRKRAVAVSVNLNLATLFLFKYSYFFAEQVFGVSQTGRSQFFHLPLGISFFTFHAISYLVDIYRRDARAERSFVNLALYMLMFPQLIAGPILRFHTIARQLQRRVVTARHVYFGFTLFCFGMAQKVLLADTLAGICDPLFARWQTLSSQTAWLAATTYTLQIYFDFGGYSNMAIGLGWMSGFHFPKNFNYPYISKSITEFWRRWHMSLSRWFRDYLYIPLGGNRLGPLRTYRNLVIVFFLCGLWHGAAWTFILWGMYHGMLLVIERLGLETALRKTPAPIQHAYALLAVVFGWVLFRADSFEQAIGVLTRMVVPTSSDEVGVLQILTGEETLVVVLAILFSTPVIPWALRKFVAVPTLPPWRRDLSALSYGAGTAAAALVLVASAIKILSGSYSPFIYFRF
jgi:alginate O-acetyltransferase complex protein AlgI